MTNEQDTMLKRQDAHTDKIGMLRNRRDDFVRIAARAQAVAVSKRNAAMDAEAAVCAANEAAWKAQNNADPVWIDAEAADQAVQDLSHDPNADPQALVLAKSVYVWLLAEAKRLQAKTDYAIENVKIAKKRYTSAMDDVTAATKVSEDANKFALKVQDDINMAYATVAE